MKRIAVIGNAGGGKSTLSRRLAAMLDLPYHAVDDLMWGPGWKLRPDRAFRRDHDTIIADDRWVIDGVGPWDSVAARLERADTIVHVDLSLPRHFLWVAKRRRAAKKGLRPPAPDGCDYADVGFAIVPVMWRVHKAKPKLKAEIERHRATARVAHLRTPADISDFLNAAEFLVTEGQSLITNAAGWDRARSTPDRPRT